MNPGLAYWWIFHTVSLILAFVFTVIIGLVGYYILKPDKLVRILFPYIKREGTTANEGNNTAVESEMFGRNLSDNGITVHFFMAIRIIFYTLWIFFSNTFIIYEGYNNPYNIELNCFYDNGTLVELSHWEQMMEPVWCYVINTNIAWAAGLATGALAVAWLVAAIETWIIVKIKKKRDKSKNLNEENKIKGCKAYFCKVYFYYLLIILAITTIAIIIIWTQRKFFTKEARDVFLLENIVIIVIPFEKLIPLICIRNLFENTNKNNNRNKKAQSYRFTNSEKEPLLKDSNDGPNLRDPQPSRKSRPITMYM